LLISLTQAEGHGSCLRCCVRYEARPRGQNSQTCRGDLEASVSPSAPTPWRWRFQGRILESADGSTDLYDFQARSYDPSLGAFTSFDSVAGSAQNPLTLNRFLYANANPATLVDPDGHRAVLYIGEGDDMAHRMPRITLPSQPDDGGGTPRIQLPSQPDDAVVTLPPTIFNDDQISPGPRSTYRLNSDGSFADPDTWEWANRICTEAGADLASNLCKHWAITRDRLARDKAEFCSYNEGLCTNGIDLIDGLNGLYQQTLGELVNRVVFPDGITAGMCIGGGIGLGGFFGDSVCIVHGADGQWAHIKNVQIGGTTGASISGQVTFFTSDAASVQDLRGWSWDMGGSAGEVVSIGGDVDTGFGRYGQVVRTVNVSVGAGLSSTPIMGWGGADVHGDSRYVGLEDTGLFRTRSGPNGH
jgi:RHS repeat-associated protein